MYVNKFDFTPVPSEYVSAQQVTIPKSINWCHLVVIEVLITGGKGRGGVVLSLQQGFFIPQLGPGLGDLLRFLLAFYFFSI